MVACQWNYCNSVSIFFSPCLQMLQTTKPVRRRYNTAPARCSCQASFQRRVSANRLKTYSLAEFAVVRFMQSSFGQGEHDDAAAADRVEQGVTYQIISYRTSRAGRGRIATFTVSLTMRIQSPSRCSPGRRGSPPRFQTLSGEQAGRSEGSATYRPRSVSSLLMRLRAMATCVVGCAV
jgi:hypothetical protein